MCSQREELNFRNKVIKFSKKKKGELDPRSKPKKEILKKPTRPWVDLSLKPNLESKYKLR